MRPRRCLPSAGPSPCARWTTAVPLLRAWRRSRVEPASADACLRSARVAGDNYAIAPGCRTCVRPTHDNTPCLFHTAPDRFRRLRRIDIRCVRWRKRSGQERGALRNEAHPSIQEADHGHDARFHVLPTQHPRKPNRRTTRHRGGARNPLLIHTAGGTDPHWRCRRIGARATSPAPGVVRCAIRAPVNGTCLRSGPTPVHRSRARPSDTLRHQASAAGRHSALPADTHCWQSHFRRIPGAPRRRCPR